MVLPDIPKGRLDTCEGMKMDSVFHGEHFAQLVLALSYLGGRLATFCRIHYVPGRFQLQTFCRWRCVCVVATYSTSKLHMSCSLNSLKGAI